MPGERIQRQINALLDEAEGALKALKWEVVKERALAVLALDESNQDAEAYLKAANSRLGTGTAPPAVKTPPPLETCQIEYSITKSFLGMGGDYYFWAAAASPVAGQYAAGCSPFFRPGFMQGLQNWATRYYDWNPQSWDGNAAQAHSALVNLLLKEGWEPTPFRGHQWWQHTFQRPVRREEDGWFVVFFGKKWGGYWMCDPEAKVDDDPDLQQAMAAGKVRKDHEGVWIEEGFFVEWCKKSGGRLESIIPASLDTHMVTLRPADSVLPRSGDEPEKRGTSLSGQWAYDEITVPLDLSHRDTGIAGRVATIVGERLAKARQDGWEPDEPTDWDSLWKAGRVKWSDPGVFAPRPQYHSVTIRLKRLVQ